MKLPLPRRSHRSVAKKSPRRCIIEPLEGRIAPAVTVQGSGNKLTTTTGTAKLTNPLDKLALGITLDLRAREL